MTEKTGFFILFPAKTAFYVSSGNNGMFHHERGRMRRCVLSDIGFGFVHLKRRQFCAVHFGVYLLQFIGNLNFLRTVLHTAFAVDAGIRAGFFRNGTVIVVEQPAVAGNFVLIVDSEDFRNFHADRTRHTVTARRAGNCQMFAVGFQRRIQHGAFSVAQRLQRRKRLHRYALLPALRAQRHDHRHLP